MRFDVIGFGALNVDKFHYVDKIAHEGEESSIIETSESPGGSAANTIVGLARLNVKTGFIGKVADDHEGQLLIKDFLREGVNTNGIVMAKKSSSGTVSAFIDTHGERALYVHPSVNDSLTFNEVDLEYVGKTEFLHLTSFHEKPFRAQKRVVEELVDVRVSLDPGEIYAQKGLSALKSIITRCDVVMPSENELRMLTGKGWKEGAERLLKEGAEIVAVKLGQRGCYIVDGRQKHLIPSIKTRVVDTTGAGDAFCAGFLYGLVKEKDLFECGRLGNFVASKCIGKVGARTGLPRAEELGGF